MPGFIKDTHPKKCSRWEIIVRQYILKSDQLWITVLFTVLAGRWRRFIISCVLFVPLSLHPALREDHLLGPMRWRP